MQWYSDKGWNNTALMRFLRSCSTLFYSPYLVVSQIGSYSFLNRHRTDMRRSHLCGQRFQGVAMLCLALVELRWYVSTLWKTVSSTERFMGTEAAANAAQCRLFPGIWGALQNTWKLMPTLCLWSLSAWMWGQQPSMASAPFLLRVRFGHGCTEWDPQELVTNISSKTLMQVSDRKRYSLKSLMPLLISCAWAVILAARWFSETTVCTA